MICCPSRPRLLARFRGGPPVELWRAKHIGGYITENAMLALTGGMSEEWQIETFRPLRDGDAIGRIAKFDADGQIPGDPVEELAEKDDDE